MKKSYYILSLLVFLSLCFVVNAQEKVVIKDTVYVTKDYQTHLVFGKGLSYFTLGSGVVDINNSGKPNKVNEEQVVSIKARNKFRRQTNITAANNENTWYNIDVIFIDQIPEDNLYFYDTDVETFTNEQYSSYKKEKDVFVEEADYQREIEENLHNIYFNDTIEYIETAKRLNSNPKRGKRGTVGKMYQGIGMKLYGAFSRKDKFFLKLVIDNNTSYPFDIKRFNFSDQNLEGTNQQSTNDQSIKPIYIYDTKLMSVLPKGHKYLTFVFNKFFIEKKKHLHVYVYEKDTEHKLYLKIPANYVNNPEPLQKRWSQKFLDDLKKKEKEMRKQEKEELKKNISSKEAGTSKEEIKLLSDKNNKSNL